MHALRPIPAAPPLPPTAADNPHLNRLRTLARVLDDLAPIPGTRMRVGLDPLIGLVPGAGDAVGGAVSAYALVVAYRLGAPPSVLARMVGNVAVDVLTGFVPLVGDLFDFGWKASRKNVRLVERYAGAPERVKRSSGLVLVFALAAVAAIVVGIGWAIVALFGALRGWSPSR